MDIHEVRQRLGKPGYNRCSRCHGHAKAWVYDGKDPDERTVEVPVGFVGGSTRSLRYSNDLARYSAICRVCALRVPADQRVVEAR